MYFCFNLKNNNFKLQNFDTFITHCKNFRGIQNYYYYHLNSENKGKKKLHENLTKYIKRLFKSFKRNIGF